MEQNCVPIISHMLIKIPPKYSVSQIMGYLKGKSMLMIFNRHANMAIGISGVEDTIWIQSEKHKENRRVYQKSIDRNEYEKAAYLNFTDDADHSALMNLWKNQRQKIRHYK